jgi:50S ribosomal subunit-associated GTPase HflX
MLLARRGGSQVARLRSFCACLSTRTSTFLVSPIVVDLHHEQRWGRTWQEARKNADLFASHRQLEAASLVKAANLHLTGVAEFRVRSVKGSSFLGPGQLNSVKRSIGELGGVESVFIDCALNSIQMRRIEEVLGTRVIDRFGMILAIFGRRARTREAQLQVELARIYFTKSRLRRSSSGTMQSLSGDEVSVRSNEARTHLTQHLTTDCVSTAAGWNRNAWRRGREAA